MIPKEDLDIFRGDEKEFPFQVKKNGMPLDITGMTLKFTVKKNLVDADPGYFQKSTSDGIVIAAGTQGNLTVTVAPEDTDDAPSSEVVYFYDLQLTAAPGKPKTVASGPFKIIPDVTRTT